MKKKIVSLLLVLMVLLMFVPNLASANEPIKLWVNGNYIETDVAPFIENDRTLVPIRVVSETLGYKVDWVEETKEVIITSIGKTMVLIIDNPNSTVGGKTVSLDVAPKLVNSRTFVPIRFIAEEFGQKVDWDNDNRTVIVGEGYSAPIAKQPDKVETQPQKPTPNPNVSSEFKAALKKAQTYSDRMHMSKQGLYNQLTSAYGEKFPEDAAKYAIENINVDWNKNALEKAKSYATKMHMSKQGVYDQLVSEFGEKFLPEEAQFAVDNLVHDWNANALEKAKTYQARMNMSKEGIRNQLTSQYGEKFTADEAAYAIENLK
jgi:hypothetical protein